MNRIELIETILKALQPGYSGFRRDSIEELLYSLGWLLVHNEPGKYDYTNPTTGEYEHGNGFIVYKDPDSGKHIKIMFEEDSYNGGYVSDYVFVTPKQETVEVFEVIN